MVNSIIIYIYIYIFCLFIIFSTHPNKQREFFLFLFFLFLPIQKTHLFHFIFSLFLSFLFLSYLHILWNTLSFLEFIYFPTNRGKFWEIMKKFKVGSNVLYLSLSRHHEPFLIFWFKKKNPLLAFIFWVVENQVCCHSLYLLC